METKKSKTGLIIAIAGGTLALITIIAIAISKSKKKSTDNNGGGGGGETGEPNSKSNWLGTLFNFGQTIVGSLKGNAPAGTSWKVIQFDEKTTGATDLLVTLATPRPHRGEISSNDKIRLSGMGKFDGETRIYYNKGIWYDGNGDAGGIFIKTNKVTENKNNVVSSTNYPNAKITKI